MRVCAGLGCVHAFATPAKLHSDEELEEMMQKMIEATRLPKDKSVTAIEKLASAPKHGAGKELTLEQTRVSQTTPKREVKHKELTMPLSERPKEEIIGVVKFVTVSKPGGITIASDALHHSRKKKDR